MDRARAVVVGGGITGASVAYHLAKAGWRDTVLLEKDELTSGSTCHAAGLVTQFNPSPTMMRFRRYSIELYEELGVFERVGSLRVASTEESLKELQRGVSRARGIGLDVELISAEESERLMPAITKQSLYGAIWIPADGHLDPHIATHALAAAARRLGAKVLTQHQVTGIRLGPGGKVKAVETDQGMIEADVVVVAGGIWAPQIAAMAGAFIVSTPVDHQHAALLAVPGNELPHDMPCFRDPDNLVYGKSEAGGVVLGGYEADPVARWIDGVPWNHAGTSLPPDQARFEPLLAGAARRFPFLRDAGIVKLVCHPDAMTPDSNPLVGPFPGVGGLYIAAGLSLNGFGGGGGIGRSLAELITAGETELDLYPYRPWRFGPVHRDHRYAAELAREAYRYYYYLRYPLDSDEWGRPKRTSALHERLQDCGAVFGSKHGWERAEYFQPGSPWRRAGADQRAFGWTRPPYFDQLAEEHRAFRERVGIIDMTSFGKIDVTGPAALTLLERAAGNRIDRPVGTVVYTQLLERDGGIAADVTVTRLGKDHFRVVSGAGFVSSDLGWLRLQMRDDDEAVEIRETTDELSVIGMWGPNAREVMELVTDTDVSESGFGFMQAKDIYIGGKAALAQRVTYVGELGFELYVDPGWAVQVWDRLMAAGREFGIVPGGYRALDSLRMEKGYRYYGTDLTLLDNPFEAGLGFCVHLDKGEFNGRQALLAAREAGLKRRLRTLAVGGQEYLPIYGGEAVHAPGGEAVHAPGGEAVHAPGGEAVHAPGGEAMHGEPGVIGRLRSCAYGFTVSKNLAYCYLPVGMVPGAQVHVEVFGELVPATVMADAVVPKRAAEQLTR